MAAKFEMLCDSINGDQEYYKSSDNSNSDILKVLYAQKNFMEKNLKGKLDPADRKTVSFVKTRHKSLHCGLTETKNNSSQFHESVNQTWKTQTKRTQKIDSKIFMESQLHALKKQTKRGSLAFKREIFQNPNKLLLKNDNKNFALNLRENKNKELHITFGQVKNQETPNYDESRSFNKTSVQKKPVFDICDRLDALNCVRFRL